MTIWSLGSIDTSPPPPREFPVSSDSNYFVSEPEAPLLTIAGADLYCKDPEGKIATHIVISKSRIREISHNGAFEVLQTIASYLPNRFGMMGTPQRLQTSPLMDVETIDLAQRGRCLDILSKELFKESPSSTNLQISSRIILVIAEAKFHRS
jgi:hypothetical protein